MTVLQKSGKVILLGNEAIVRGALEAGVQFVSTYPGTPSSEVGIVFSQIAKKMGVYFEFSTNEKVALEAGIGASFSGLKTLAAMKNFGLNVASDALLPFLYTGSKGPTVIMVADDPSCHSSAQSEENSRGFANLAHIPILEPSDPQECLEFTKLAFQLSEKFNLPVMLRTTTRVSHQKMPVKLGRLPAKSQPGSGFAQGKFVKDKHRFLTMPPRVLEQHQELLEKIEKIRQFSEKIRLNKILGGRSSQDLTRAKGAGIIASGVSYLYVREALEQLGLSLPVLKINLFYPLAEKQVSSFIKKLNKVLVVEELEPYLEKEVAQLAKEVNPKLKIFGKDTLPEVGELSPDLVGQAAAKLTGKRWSKAKQRVLPKIKHLPRFCTVPQCPYWKMFAAVKKAIPEGGAVFGGDIGCYMIAALKPTNLYDYISCMGASLGIAHGIAKATKGKQRVVAFMGDSTFFHAGIPALINASYNNSDVLLIVADNRITAMTGHQPNPGSGRTGMGDPSTELKIDEIAKAVGVKHIAVIDPVQDFDGAVKSIKAFFQKPGPAVIVSRHICALLEKRMGKK